MSAITGILFVKMLLRKFFITGACTTGGWNDRRNVQFAVAAWRSKMHHSVSTEWIPINLHETTPKTNSEEQTRLSPFRTTQQAGGEPSRRKTTARAWREVTIPLAGAPPSLVSISSAQGTQQQPRRWLEVGSRGRGQWQQKEVRHQGQYWCQNRSHKFS